MLMTLLVQTHLTCWKLTVADWVRRVGVLQGMIDILIPNALEGDVFKGVKTAAGKGLRSGRGDNRKPQAVWRGTVVREAPLPSLAHLLLMCSSSEIMRLHENPAFHNSLLCSRRFGCLQ